MSGGIKVIGLYASMLQARGHTVTVITRENPNLTIAQYLRAIRTLTPFPKYKRVHPNHLEGMDLDIRWLARDKALADLDVPDGDIVIATFWRTAQEVRNLSPRKGKKFYFMQDYGAPGMELEKLILTWKMPLEIITIANWLAELIKKNTGRDDVFVVHNSVERSFLNFQSRSKQPVPTFGFLYRENLVKGYDLVLDAFELAKKSVPDIRFLTFGPEPPRKNLPDRFEFRLSPATDELQKIYSACDAWIFASRSEGFGLPILEAMASRTPVIATPAGVAPEFLKRGGGLLLNSFDASELADAIVEISGMKPDRWVEMSERAFREVNEYSWDDATNIFESILKNAGSRSDKIQQI